MAAFLRLDQGQYLDGLITLFRGDDWTLVGKIRNGLPGNYFEDVNCVGVAATAFFPTDPTLNLATTQAAPVVFTNAAAGEFQITLAASGSSGTLLTPNGSTMYMQTVQSSGTKVTFQTNDSPIQIQDRTFLQF